MVSPQGPSSFIPKSPTKSTARPRGVRKIYVFTYLSLVLFFGTLIASAGTFFFEFSLKNQLASQKQELANEQNAFNARDLERLRDLNNRIENAKRLLSTHVSVADIFTALETSTVATVQLTGVEYERTEFGGIRLSLSALTKSLNDARFQRDIFASNEILRKAGVVEPKLTTRSEQIQGGVTELTDRAVIFTLAGEYDVNDIPYQRPDEVLTEPDVSTSTGTTTDDGAVPVTTDMDAEVPNDEGV